MRRPRFERQAVPAGEGGLELLASWSMARKREVESEGEADGYVGRWFAEETRESAGEEDGVEDVEDMLCV